MIDHDVIDALRSEAISSSASILLILLKEIKGDELSQFEMIRIFKEAFPDIPLRILNEASTSRLIAGSDGMEDGELNRLLESWLPIRE